MRTSTPALVTDREVEPLPRYALLGLCACWLLPGLWTRDPWRNADLISFALMKSIAEGRSAWTEPLLGGMPIDVPWVSLWLGAAALSVLAPLGVDAVVAARLPYAGLMAGSMACVWYAAASLSRQESAQPLPLALGGDPAPRDYCRAIADGALLALMATLGLLQLGHEATPEVVQLFCIAGLMLAVAQGLRRPHLNAGFILAALLGLSVSGAPAIAVSSGLSLGVVLLLVGPSAARVLGIGALLGAAAAALMAWRLGAFAWEIDLTLALTQAPWVARQWLWFTWPAWPLVLWTLWRWRRALKAVHLCVPLALVATPGAGSILMGGDDRVLLLCLPALSLLAAFALPTLRRSASAAIDWFSVSFFSVAALTIWFMYAAFQTGFPARPAANVAKLATGFTPAFSLWEFATGLMATGAWIFLVRWRTGRHRSVLWKSMILPSAGVVLCWMLLMSLWFPLLDYARSGRPIVDRINMLAVGKTGICTYKTSSALVASLEVFGGGRPVSIWSDNAPLACDVLITTARSEATSAPPGWRWVGAFRRPTDRTEEIAVYQR